MGGRRRAPAHGVGQGAKGRARTPRTRAAPGRARCPPRACEIADRSSTGSGHREPVLTRRGRELQRSSDLADHYMLGVRRRGVFVSPLTPCRLSVSRRVGADQRSRSPRRPCSTPGRRRPHARRRCHHHERRAPSRARDRGWLRVEVRRLTRTFAGIAHCDDGPGDRGSGRARRRRRPRAGRTRGGAAVHGHANGSPARPVRRTRSRWAP